MKALLLEDAPLELLNACETAALQAVLVASAEQGRALLFRDRFDLVDGRLAAPAPLDEEIRRRVAGFFDRLGSHAADGLYHAVMRAVERPLIVQALARAGGVRAAAAAQLGIDRGTLVRRMRALGLDGEVS
jgi:Fis family transcriptional regulator